MIARVCSVIGTGQKGTLILAAMAISAVPASTSRIGADRPGDAFRQKGFGEGGAARSVRWHGHFVMFPERRKLERQL